MTVKELKEYLSHYKDDAEVIVAVSDNVECFYEYTSRRYDTWVQGDKDIREYGEIERDSTSDIVYIKVYR